mmetsp:Transcript_51055/g.144569  ORF Transcript_51055/g.144569 Transcript_51055/m.144569 type:complete len:214 (-) Transcript_51055:20-661(-)
MKCPCRNTKRYATSDSTFTSALAGHCFNMVYSPTTWPGPTSATFTPPTLMDSHPCPTMNTALFSSPSSISNEPLLAKTFCPKTSRSMMCGSTRSNKKQPSSSIRLKSTLPAIAFILGEKSSSWSNEYSRMSVVRFSGSRPTGSASHKTSARRPILGAQRAPPPGLPERHSAALEGPPAANKPPPMAAMQHRPPPAKNAISTGRASEGGVGVDK